MAVFLLRNKKRSLRKSGKKGILTFRDGLGGSYQENPRITYTHKKKIYPCLRFPFHILAMVNKKPKHPINSEIITDNHQYNTSLYHNNKFLTINSGGNFILCRADFTDSYSINVRQSAGFSDLRNKRGNLSNWLAVILIEEYYSWNFGSTANNSIRTAEITFSNSKTLSNSFAKDRPIKSGRMKNVPCCL